MPLFLISDHTWVFQPFFSTFLPLILEYISLSFSVSPPFGPAVLKPGFDLGVCHFESFSQSCSFSAGQVFLSVEALLQLTDLHSRERRTGLLSLRWCAVLVRVTNTPSHSERRQGCCSMNKEGKASERWCKLWRVWHTVNWPPSVTLNHFSGQIGICLFKI